MATKARIAHKFTAPDGEVLTFTSTKHFPYVVAYRVRGGKVVGGQWVVDAEESWGYRRCGSRRSAEAAARAEARDFNRRGVVIETEVAE